ncbi:type 1 fimbrial major subunit FimA [Enterobacter bugandensis]|uniref:type 1 fimbrial major subunit FimA n=1 Tax=Enterobacter bugandensis TaxID=881260 RepID=UPI002361372B|nr:type 1 fimbrial major subunit FimA [Enterobacter bugandensis]
MSAKTILMSAMAALSITSATAFAETTGATTTTVSGGTVHFKGEIVNAACSVDSNSSEQTVNLGQIRSAKLNKAGATSSLVGFNIELGDCDTSVSSKASVAFSGPTIDTANPNVLALQSSSAGGASNVGVQILDKTGTPLALDGTAFSAATTLNDGKNVIPFQARYYATGVATAGTANADATFKVQYQ